MVVSAGTLGELRKALQERGVAIGRRHDRDGTSSTSSSTSSGGVEVREAPSACPQAHVSAGDRLAAGLGAVLADFSLSATWTASSSSEVSYMGSHDCF
jgi:hypothetical protein